VRPCDWITAQRCGNKTVGVIDVLSESQQITYILVLCELYDHEHDFNRGRFAAFCFEKQEYQITFCLAKMFNFTFADLHWQSLSHLVGRMIDWVAEHGRDQPWSLTGTMPSITSAEVTFSFADPIVAVYFKLVWI
jgi:hypothetical protein